MLQEFKVISHTCASHSGPGGSASPDVRPGILVMTPVVIRLGKIEAVKSKGPAWGIPHPNPYSWTHTEDPKITRKEETTLLVLGGRGKGKHGKCICIVRTS